MPAVPEFIPLPKAKQLFALSSWRDDGAAPASAAAKTQAATTAASPTPQGTAAAAAAAEDGNGNDDGKKKSSSRRGRRQRGKKENANANALPVEAEDHWLHVMLPKGLAWSKVNFDLQAAVTPLRTLEIGDLKTLLPRRVPPAGAPNNNNNNNNNSNNHSSNNNNGISGGNNASDSNHNGGASGGSKRLSPFETPALVGAAATPAMAMMDSASMMLPPSMVLPPSSDPAYAPPPPGGSKSVSHNNNNNNDSTEAAAETSSAYQVSLLFADKEEAEKAQVIISRRWSDTVTTSLSARSRSQLNASLVLKGLPSLSKTEVLLSALERDLLHRPSYVRLHRGERGVFKNVLFVKYATREAAEDSKLRLERFVLGSRPLKVEFKKKCKPLAAAAAPGGGSMGDACGGAAATSSASHHVSSGGTPPPPSSSSTAAGSSDSAWLTQLVRDLRVSTEHAGFAYDRSDVTKEGLKLLKQLCQTYNLQFDMTDTRVTVRRQLGVSAEKPSPSLKAQSTPSWVPATPTPLRPMDFKGISHWKEIRNNQQGAHGIVRPLGPEDGMPSFAAGRGRPV